MNLMLILGLVFISAVNLSKSETNVCQNSKRKFSVIPNLVFSNIDISTVEDLIWNMTQLDIIMTPTPDFANSNGSIILSTEQKYCGVTSKHSINLNENIITIPESGQVARTLKPGCNYSLEFYIGEYCTYKYYKIPEQQPCQSYLPEDIFTSFPNRVINNVSVNAFRNNAIRLNILFSPRAEFINHTGYIVINSKMGRCNHPEEFTFRLDETNLTIPRAEFPHSFIDSGCEYMIDFEIDQYCITTTYKIPDFCTGNEPQGTILDIVEEEENIYKVFWEQNISKRNKTHSIIHINYRLDHMEYEIFNEQMVVENQYNLHYSVLNFSMLSKGRTYKLIATFVNDHQCSNVSSKVFKLKSDFKMILKLSAIFTVTFASVALICIFVPTLRTRIVIVFKLLSGVAVQVPASQTSDKKYISKQKREEINLDYIPLELQNCDEFEIPRYRLEIPQDKEGRPGNFGIVYFGRLLGKNKTKGFTPVAIKTLKDNAPPEEIKALEEEISTLKQITMHGNHENVVKMLGCCIIERPHMMILELVACGDLKSYLVDLRIEWASRKGVRSNFPFPDDGSNGLYISPPHSRTYSETTSVPSPTETESTILYDDADDSLLSVSVSTPGKIIPALSNMELQNFALQIAKGMAFLESISVVHRDLAARNVLINEMKILKISDFGMSRIGDYVHRNTGQQPLRWMALESIEKFISTSKSDVWSFGVVLWEIGTLGAFPYDSIPNEYILEYLLYNLKKGIRLMRPEICTDELYSLMLKCWTENPADRPSFQQIVEHLSGKEKKIYLDFQKLNPAYVFPPTKYS